MELAPAEHAWHSTLPLAVDSRPAGQPRQASPPEFVPSPSTSYENRVTYEPTSHVAHPPAPFRSLGSLARPF